MCGLTYKRNHNKDFHARFLSENKKLNIYVIITETYGSPLFTSYCGLAT